MEVFVNGKGEVVKRVVDQRALGFLQRQFADGSMPNPNEFLENAGSGKVAFGVSGQVESEFDVRAAMLHEAKLYKQGKR